MAGAGKSLNYLNKLHPVERVGVPALLLALGLPSLGRAQKKPLGVLARGADYRGVPTEYSAEQTLPGLRRTPSVAGFPTAALAIVFVV